MSTFITFYSFKGGVGRTLALANVATLLTKDTDEPCRVLAWDFDLAAPGLQQVLGCSWGKERLGFVDCVLSYLNNAKLDEIDKYIHKTSVSGLDILPAGFMDRAYASKLEKIRWREIYRQARGFNFIEAVKKQIADFTPGYDYVLVDSLTGYSDVGGICVKQIPDIVVLVFRLNEQNIGGISKVYKSIKKTRDTRDKIIQVVPVISPAWPFAAPDTNKWIKKAQRTFDEKKVLDISFEGGLTFGEKVISRDRKPYAMTSKVVDDYRRLTHHLRSLNPMDFATIYRSLAELRGEARFAEAIEACLKLVKHKPRLPKYWQEFSHALLLAPKRQQKDQVWEEANATINQQCDANNPFALIARAAIKEGSSETPDAAFDDLSKAIKIAPQLREPYRLRAMSFMQRKQYSQALRDFSSFLDLNPPSSQAAAVLGSRAELHMELEDPESAIRDLSEAIKLKPHAVGLAGRRARALYMAERYDEAAKEVAKALDDSPGDGRVNLLKAHLLVALGQPDEASRILSELASSALTSELNLAEAYLLIEPKKASQLLERMKGHRFRVAFWALRCIGALLLGAADLEQICREEIKKLKSVSEEQGGWSWLEIRQFLKWGPNKKLLTAEQRDEISKLIDELETPAVAVEEAAKVT
ncbi:MAG TPA: tetratricopeptide repeat protein [Terriglobales bacterium]|nr:tetratricopeptide repeat protein [Terriglobales bacterium]